MSFHLETEKDVERLRQAALLLEAENKRLVARVSEALEKATHSATMHGTVDVSGAGTLRTSERYDSAHGVPWSGVPYLRQMQWDASGRGRMDSSSP